MSNPLSLREIAVYDESFVAGEDLSSDQYKIVKLHTTAGQVVKAGAGEGIGILQNKPESGQEARVRLLGLSRLFVNANAPNLSPGDKVKSDANGFGVQSTTVNDLPIGTVMQFRTADGLVASVMLIGLVRDHS